MPEPIRVVETKALEVAVEARTLIMAHINECDRKHGDIMRKFSDVTADVGCVRTEAAKVKEDLSRQMSRGQWAIIGLLLTVIGYFLVRFGLPGHG